MLLADLIAISLRQIYRNKRRYKGAIIGTALGIAGLITVVTMGDSVESTLGKNLEILGNATLVKAQWDFHNTPRWHHGEYRQSDMDDLKRLPGVLTVSKASWKSHAKIVHENKHFQGRVGGIEEDFFETQHMPVTQGRKLDRDDVKERKSVCIIGQTVQRELLGHDPPVGKKLQTLGLTLEVVGVLGGAEDPSFMETVFVPFSVLAARVQGMDKIRDISVRAQDWDTVPGLHRQVKEKLTSNQPGYAESMMITYSADRIAAIKTIVVIFKIFLYAAISVTLILGGVGITNVMLAVVHERTKEIGLRKAVGATVGMIMSQFLCESLTVSLVGGIIGILTGVLGVESLQRVFDTEAQYRIFLLSILGSVAIAVVLGVASGMLPAARAGRLSAVEAMRFE
jgi:putative ABC transport system permease protein